ncbi:MAG TPA: hypothetical protein DDY43_14085 [Synechococcales bacterium UBA10510]|nr:hypothetical protein [Synechococcales bacterium UBA10510]
MVLQGRAVGLAQATQAPLGELLLSLTHALKNLRARIKPLNQEHLLMTFTAFEIMPPWFWLIMNLKRQVFRCSLPHASFALQSPPH